MGFGPVFRTTVKLFYRKAFTRVGVLVEKLGVWQGCPLSPLLFLVLGTSVGVIESNTFYHRCSLTWR